MKKIVIILAVCGFIAACASMPSDVKDFVGEPGHVEIAAKCAGCHLNLTDGI